MENIYEAIRNDHDIQRTLCKKIIATSGESKERAELWKAFKNELTIHADAEERFFYSPLIHDDMMQEHARHGIAEHHELEELIAKVEESEMTSAAWLVHAKALCEKVTHHLDEEEHTFFQLSGKVLTEKQKKELASNYQKFMKENR